MCYLIETSETEIVTDPYLSNSFDCEESVRKYPPSLTLDEIMPDIIIISHEHGDHLDPETLAPFYRQRKRSFTPMPEPITNRMTEIGGEVIGLFALYAAIPANLSNLVT